MPGRHNVLNSLAAAGVALELDVPFEVMAESLSQVGIIHRRFEIKGEEEGVLVIDDYGHHPTEIKAILAALKSCFPKRRSVVVFQPHRFTRVKALFGDFTTAFNQADRLIMTEIYPAGEQPIEGVNGRVLFEAVRSHGHHEVDFVPDFNNLAQEVSQGLSPNDLVLTLGAGSITRVGDQILRLLKDEARD
jgi:UDP-N-acetylmuramate--alanine ligase